MSQELTEKFTRLLIDRSQPKCREHIIRYMKYVGEDDIELFLKYCEQFDNYSFSLTFDDDESKALDGYRKISCHIMDFISENKTIKLNIIEKNIEDIVEKMKCISERLNHELRVKNQESYIKKKKWMKLKNS